MPSTSFEIKIDRIKHGTQPLHVGFDPSKYYFVCGYYNDIHQKEGLSYCCAEQYTWIKYDHENDIREYYDNKKFIVAFQINSASFVTDILSDEATGPFMEHFQLYDADFANGSNVNTPIIFDETFIYLNSSDKSNIYHSLSAYNNKWITLPCIRLDSKYFIPVAQYNEYFEDNISLEFGKYYDSLMSITNIKEYSVTNKQGVTTFYKLIQIHDFVNFIIEKEIKEYEI